MGEGKRKKQLLVDSAVDYLSNVIASVQNQGFLTENRPVLAVFTNDDEGVPSELIPAITSRMQNLARSGYITTQAQYYIQVLGRKMVDNDPLSDCVQIKLD